MGGAPLNFSAHFAQMGGQVDMISAVGNDENGREALKKAAEFGINTEHIAMLDKPTGCCIVTLDEFGSPEYEIVSGVAPDYIEYTDNGETYDAAYYGSLACRSDVSHNSLITLLKTNNAKEKFFDVNIRQNYYTSELLDELTSYATVLKVSREEIYVFGGGSEEEISRRLLEKYPNLKLIAVTLDKDGAFLMRRDGKALYSRRPNVKVVSTVGGGDSFSAALLFSLLSGKTDEDALEASIQRSSYVVTCVEAVPPASY